MPSEIKYVGPDARRVVVNTPDPEPVKKPAAKKKAAPKKKK